VRWCLVFCGGKGVYRIFAFLVVDWWYFKKARRSFLSINARLSRNRTRWVHCKLFVRIVLRGREPIATFYFDVLAWQNHLRDSDYNLQKNPLLRQLRIALRILHRTIDDTYVKTPTVPKLFMLFSTNDFRFQPWRLRVMHQSLSHILLGDKMMSSITFSITPQLFHLWYTRALCTWLRQALKKNQALINVIKIIAITFSIQFNLSTTSSAHCNSWPPKWLPLKQARHPDRTVMESPIEPLRHLTVEEESSR